MIVVAEVPSMEMDAMAGRRLTGISSKILKSVVLQDLTQSTVSSLFLEKTNKLLSSSYTKHDTNNCNEEFTTFTIQLKLSKNLSNREHTIYKGYSLFPSARIFPSLSIRAYRAPDVPKSIPR